MKISFALDDKSVQKSADLAWLTSEKTVLRCDSRSGRLQKTDDLESRPRALPIGCETNLKAEEPLIRRKCKELELYSLKVLCTLLLAVITKHSA